MGDPPPPAEGAHSPARPAAVGPAPSAQDDRDITRDLVVVGASAGGIDSLRHVLGGLPHDFPAAVLVVLHVPPTSVSALAGVLARSTTLPVLSAKEGLALARGRVIVAVPDHHLLIRDGRIHLGHGPRENGHRPAVDPLFRSAARWHGRHVVAVVLSGALDDGAAGASSVASRGGVVLVQDPDDAAYPGMPTAALRAVRDATVTRLVDLPSTLEDLVSQRLDDAVGDEHTLDDGSRIMTVEAGVAELDPAALDEPERPGIPSGLACPDCHGALFEIEENGFVHYRCRVGHAWSPESLLVEQSEELETALWMALRALEERAELERHLAESARAAGRDIAAGASVERAAEMTRSAEIIRELLLRHDLVGEHHDEGTRNRVLGPAAES